MDAGIGENLQLMRVAYSDTEVTGLDFVFLDSMRTEQFGIASSYLKEFAFSYENRLLGFLLINRFLNFPFFPASFKNTMYGSMPA